MLNLPCRQQAEQQEALESLTHKCLTFEEELGVSYIQCHVVKFHHPCDTQPLIVTLTHPLL